MSAGTFRQGNYVWVGVRVIKLRPLLQADFAGAEKLCRPVELKPGLRCLRMAGLPAPAPNSQRYRFAMRELLRQMRRDFGQSCVPRCGNALIAKQSRGESCFLRRNEFS